MLIYFMFYYFITNRFPKQKQKYLQEIYEEIVDKLSEKKNSSIVCVFSVQECYYRIIL